MCHGFSTECAAEKHPKRSLSISPFDDASPLRSGKCPGPCPLLGARRSPRLKSICPRRPDFWTLNDVQDSLESSAFFSSSKDIASPVAPLGGKTERRPRYCELLTIKRHSRMREGPIHPHHRRL